MKDAYEVGLESLDNSESLFFGSLFLFLVGCQPMNFKDRSADLSVSSKETIIEKEALPPFTSDKLNLVFVLDTQPGMEKFYKTSFLDKSFVRGFEGYRVKAAYTNAAVDEKLTQTKLSEVSQKCGLKTAARGAGLTLAGFYASPLFLSFGIQDLAPCFSSDVFKKSYPKVNGEFLPFELNGKKLSRHLIFSEANAETVFHDTVTKNTNSAFRSYDAPQNQNEEVFPLYATLLSLAKGASFFEEDAFVVFIVVTSSDASTDENLGADDLRENFAELYGDEDRDDKSSAASAGDRLYLIPITINKGDSLCAMRLQEMGVKNPRAGVFLDSVAQDMGKKSLNMCASPSRLSEQLLDEIRPLLSPLSKEKEPTETLFLSDSGFSPSSSFLQQPPLEINGPQDGGPHRGEY